MKETYLTDGAFSQSRPHLFLPQKIPKLHRESFRLGCHPVRAFVVGLEKWIGFFALVASLYILWEIRTIVLLFFTAVILAIALNRLVRRLQQSGAKRRVAIALAVAILLTASAVLLTLIVTRLSDQFQELEQLR